MIAAYKKLFRCPLFIELDRLQEPVFQHVSRRSVGLDATAEDENTVVFLGGGGRLCRENAIAGRGFDILVDEQR